MSASVTIRSVASSRDLNRFIDFPYTFYKDSPCWVPPLRIDQKKVLNPEKNPFFEHGKIQPFLAETTEGQTLGRIAGIVNGMHLKKYDDGNGFFGFFECVERYEVAEALLDAATQWLDTQGLRGVRGPTNPSMNDVAGLLVNGFERRPAIMMPYNLSYYEPFLLRYGFERAMTMWAYYVHQDSGNLDRLQRGAALVRRRYPDVTVRSLDMDRFDEEARAVLRIYNEAWANNWGHVPMTEHEFAHLITDLKQVVDPRIVFFVEKAGTPVAFSITLPDLNQALRHVPDGRLFPLGLLKLLYRIKIVGINECRTLLMGVLPEHTGKGFDILMHATIMENGPAYGYVASEMSWVLDSNKTMMNTAAGAGGVRTKEYAMFEKNW